MKLPSQLDRELQLARVYRSIAVLIELSTIFLVVWGFVQALQFLGSLF